MRGLLAVLISMTVMLCLGQSKIQYHDKTLKKVLRKAGVTDFSEIQELALADTLKKKNGLHGKFFEIKSNVSQYRYIYTGRVNSCRAGGCSITAKIPKEGGTEYFDYFILFDNNKTVQLVKVFNYQATHGHEITASGWLKQFVGHNSSGSLQVNKNIDAISGATISVYAITFDIEHKTELLNKL